MIKVNPTGPVTSNIMVLTDIPEKSDLTKKRVFSGKQGYLFKKMCEHADIRMESLYVSATCLHYMEPEKKSPTKPQFLKFIANHSRGIEELKEEIDFIKPNVIITVGEWPLQLLTDCNGVNRFQGSILPLVAQFDNPNIKVIPVQHPRDIYKMYQVFYYTPVYLKRAYSFKDNQDPYLEKLHIQIVQDYNTLKNYFRDNKRSPFLVADIETFYNLISCIGISLSDNTAVVVPFLEENPTPDELGEMCKLIQHGFEFFPYVNQNAAFDQTKLENAGWKIPHVLGDTMLNASVLYPELPKNLGFINSLYNNIPYFKDEGKGYQPSERLYHYCGKDCISTYQIYNKQVKEAKEIGVFSFIKNNVMEYYHVYRNMAKRGVKIDTKKRDELIDKYEIMMLTYTGDIKDTLNREINPLSSKQCMELLYDEIGLPVQKKRRANNKHTPTADEDAIDFLLLNHVNSDEVRDLLQKIVYVRKIKKILDYLNIPLHPGDIMRSSFNLAGTETGRTSTSKSGDRWYYQNADGQMAQYELGFAFQTIPKHGYELADGSRIGDDIRLMFVPRDGYEFFEGDQSKAEAVIVTVLAEDWDMYEHFYEGNLHKRTAKDVFNLASEDDVTSDQYNKGKRVRHAANYDMGPATLAKQAMCSVRDAKDILTRFHKTYWKVRGVFQRQVRDFVKKNMWLRSPYGRRRDFFVNPYNDNYLREAYAYLPQSTVAEKTKISMVNTQKRMGNIDAHFLSESHDSAFGEVKRGQGHELMAILKEEMEAPIDMRKCCLPKDIDAVIQFECALGENWKEMKEIEI